ncbi:MAG TPA: hypothetical protein VMF05_03280 [Stellaceae bacterium]|nr:hypothetical protein [Stellaceae bacterium]
MAATARPVEHPASRSPSSVGSQLWRQNRFVGTVLGCVVIAVFAAAVGVAMLLHYVEAHHLFAAR